ncbi:type II toxin-antitoxin system RelE/ParE family toxin [Paenibacillus alkalitolerans]|uniref:type II toxin-antitoxin system RelE/ParE family toxin n=1 Tax=Paenibacillus alkalitolerans TaxID=2799335 RepID=UPI0018F68893|nr:type II toxin-antitoxin system RelE/ParE family toxin [Paenibacillus alkalitolerans]
MAKEVIWTISAFKDLQNIVAYISEDSPYYAMSFYEDVMDKAKTLMNFPHRGRIVPELDDPNMRELFVHRYRIIYRVSNDNVIITTIIHGARDYRGEE